MKRRVILFFWGLIFPVVVVAAGPFWVVKMLRRGGWGSGLKERVGIFDREVEGEQVGGIYLHAVSVGEVFLAVKVMRNWGKEERFVLAVTTATGMATARAAVPEGVRVIYAPLDFGFLIRRVMRRFEPRWVVMVESELWPNLIAQAHGMGIRVGVMNGRLSERSGRRLRRFRFLVEPFLTCLERVGVPEASEVVRWRELGVREEALVVTGNVKFDSEGVEVGQKRGEFEEMLAAFPKRKVAMGVSTFAGEEEWLDAAFREAGYQSVLVPRHAERRAEVAAALGGRVILRSRFKQPKGDETLVIDSTGELRDWTRLAAVVVIGKSFFEHRGGQNPAEAIMAGVPVICGPFMGNFEPLVSELRAAGGIRMVRDREELRAALRDDLSGQVEKARAVLQKHEGAVKRTVRMFS